jgi:plasmid stabilization system protein ParE
VNKYWVRVLTAANDDAIEIAAWYTQQAGPDVAQGFAHEFAAAQNTLNPFPAMFVHDDVIGYRRIHLNHYPIVLWYQIEEESRQVLILAATHNQMSDERVRDAVRREQQGSASLPGGVSRLTTEELSELLRQRLEEARSQDLKDDL